VIVLLKKGCFVALAVGPPLLSSILLSTDVVIYFQVLPGSVLVFLAFLFIFILLTAVV